VWVILTLYSDPQNKLEEISQRNDLGDRLGKFETRIRFRLFKNHSE